MSINKLSLNYIVFTYLGTRWISKRSCSIPRKASPVFNNGIKSLFKAKLHVIHNGQFFEPVGLHICMMSLILHFCQNKTKIIICMIFGCRFGFCNTYISSCQVRVTTRSKLVLANFFNSFLGGLRCVREPNQVLKYVSQCTKFDIKTSNNKTYHYILECIAYLPVPAGGIFPDFLRPFSFPSSTRDFHSIDGIIGGSSYLGFCSR